MKERIIRKIKISFPDSKVEVIDKSHLHLGHQGVGNSVGETHFDIEVADPKFNEMSMVQRHRAIYNALSEEMLSIHALSIKAYGAD